MAYKISWEPHGIYVAYHGETSDREVAEFARIGQADERFGELRYVIHDFSECSGASHSPERVLELSAIDAAAAVSNPRIHIAIVTDRADVLRMVEDYRNSGFRGFALNIFPTLPAARRFLQHLPA